ncbi:MAG: hypothetical protein IT246_09385 [Bacteroidia bacterium]|nr:hypothetical protein [Bacteroidia bacterium]
MRIAITIIACLFIFACCKKDKDQIILHDIKGMVYNNCTDSGLANVTVYLKDGKGLNLSTVSDAVGNFIFKGVDIHSSSQYNYNIYIPSKSGTNATTFEYCGFVGTTLSFNYDEADMFFKPRVMPRYLSLNLFCNKSPITDSNDSIMFFFTNSTLHKNMPDYPYRFGGGGFYGTNSYNIGNIGNYPMGKYIIDIDKWVSGVHTYTKDSIYLEWGANKTYTINW